MANIEWAKEQCRLFTLNRFDLNEREYVALCCKSALKAYQSLMDDGHSGMSITLTRDILIKLINGEPLVKLEDKKGLWETDCDDTFPCVYHHKYYPSLYKFVEADGSVHFTDRNRVVCKYANQNDGISFSNGFIIRLVNDLMPISFPYNPTEKYTALVSEYLTDRKNGDFDTLVLESIILPNGDNRILQWAYKEGDITWQRIDSKELHERIKMDAERKKLESEISCK